MRTKTLRFSLLFAMTMGVSVHALSDEACFEGASKHYSVDKNLLKAIAITESGMKANVIGPPNKNGSYDIGMMQINSGALPTLAKFGIGQSDLLDACTNIHVGAWVLATKISRFGKTWKAVGAYNASTESKQIVYVKKVQMALAKLN